MTDVLALVSIIVGLVAILSALCGFGFKIGVMAQKLRDMHKQLTRVETDIAEIEQSLAGRDRHVQGQVDRVNIRINDILRDLPRQ